jgi:hypothetical protein
MSGAAARSLAAWGLSDAGLAAPLLIRWWFAVHSPVVLRRDARIAENGRQGKRNKEERGWKGGSRTFLDDQKRQVDFPLPWSIRLIGETIEKQKTFVFSNFLCPK